MSLALKKSYDRKVLETFDVLGCYFIDLFYNDLFLKAKHAFTTGHAKSLTETYRSHVIWFMRGIAEKPRNYVDVMKKLLEYYNHETKTITSTLSELENKILCQFIPSEYYQDFTNTNKEKVLHDIIIRAINQLGEVVLEPAQLGRIIDDHMNQGNVQLLQEKLTDIFILQREEYYSKFVDEISKANGNKTVSRDQFKKLKAEYASELKRRITAEFERDRAVALLEASLKKIAELEQNLGRQPTETSPQKLPARIITPQRVVTPQKKIESLQPATPVRTHTPIRNDTVEPSQLTKLKPIIENVGVKLSDLTLDSALNPADTESKSEETDDSDESLSEDSEEMHKKQRRALLEKMQVDDDDPGFGN
jgi:hypothetical protein